jgi:hypothetical protein
MHNFFRGNKQQNFWRAFSVIFKTLPEVNNRPRGEISPILVALEEKTNRQTERQTERQTKPRLAHKRERQERKEEVLLSDLIAAQFALS